MTAAYDQLISEGYITVRQGRQAHGHVRGTTSLHQTRIASTGTHSQVSAYASRAMALPKNISAEPAALQYGLPVTATLLRRTFPSWLGGAP